MSIVGTYFLHWGVVQISLGNLLVIGAMILIFVAALVVPFPGHGSIEPPPAELAEDASARTTSSGPGANWTIRLRHRLSHLVPNGQALPDRQPVYVESWIYVFGVLSLAAFVVVATTGLILAIEGSNWWHTSSIGHFVNSTHLWSVELFFAVMVIHLWGKFFMAAWRGRRGMTWVTGMVAFFGSIGTAFTGYLSQSNFDSQWISTQAKDGLNAAGVGAYFNVLDGSQMLLWHIALLPLLVGVLVVMHIVLIRRHGVVPPIDAADPDEEPVPLLVDSPAALAEASATRGAL
jgi:ubiquinol-cytochrome c reductase cytochrome b subunit